MADGGQEGIHRYLLGGAQLHRQGIDRAGIRVCKGPRPRLGEGAGQVKGDPQTLIVRGGLRHRGLGGLWGGLRPTTPQDRPQQITASGEKDHQKKHQHAEAPPGRGRLRGGYGSSHRGKAGVGLGHPQRLAFSALLVPIEDAHPVGELPGPLILSLQLGLWKTLHEPPQGTSWQNLLRAEDLDGPLNGPLGPLLLLLSEFFPPDLAHLDTPTGESIGVHRIQPIEVDPPQHSIPADKEPAEGITWTGQGKSGGAQAEHPQESSRQCADYGRRVGAFDDGYPQSHTHYHHCQQQGEKNAQPQRTHPGGMGGVVLAGRGPSSHRCTSPYRFRRNFGLLLAPKGGHDQGGRPQQGEEVKQDQAAPVGPGVEVSLLQQHSHAPEGGEKIHLRGLGHLDGAVHLVGHISHHQSQYPGNHCPFSAEHPSQQLISLKGAYRHDHPAERSHIAQLAHNNDTGHAQ